MPTRNYGESEGTTKAQAGNSTDDARPIGTSDLGLLFKDRYLIQKELGRGGTGIVYLAHDQQLLLKPVVVKVLLEETGQDPWFRKKFQQEMEALARLDHPGIVGVLDSGLTPDGSLFLVMQFIKGQNLRAMIKHEGMDLEDVARIVRQIGLALTTAHEQNVIHCDLKPENIMLQELGSGEQYVKIVDFGVAKIRDSKVASADKTRIAGTPAYMAPEQIQGRPSASSDIYAFGVIAYEMLTGRRPFNVSVYQALDAIKAGVTIKPKDLRPELPAAAQDLILNAMSYDPAQRPHQARDFGESLARILTTDSRAPEQPASTQESEVEVPYVLFMDIVGYSRLATDNQTGVYRRLQDVVGSTATFQRVRAGNRVISRSTGDGMALVFFDGPTVAVQCATEISAALRPHPEIKLRMGINTGPVYRVKDMNQADDVAGAGINMAQRVMDCGDDGHILVSRSVAEVLKEISEWRQCLHDLGQHKVKHGAPVHLFNLYSDHYGNPRLPDKLRKNRTRTFVMAAIVILVAVAVAIGLLQTLRKGTGTDAASVREAPPAAASANQVVSPAASVAELASADAPRSLSYSLKVQKYRDGKPYKSPISMAGADTTNFEKDDRLKLEFTSGQQGYFYLLNEPPNTGNHALTYIILFASTESGDSPAPLKMEFPGDIWLKFDEKEGAETIWLIWSAQKVPALEAVKSLDNETDNGLIRNPDQAKAVAEVLKRYQVSEVIATQNDKRTGRELKAKGDLLLYPLVLQHH